MSNSVPGGKPDLYPTAPQLLSGADDFQRGECTVHGAPPPSYEESLKMSGPPTFYQSPPYYQQPPQPYQFPTQQPMTYGPTPSSYGYVNPYPVHMQQHQTYYNTATPTDSSQMTPSQNVLHFDKRAQIRTLGGAIAVPPPPPGIAPSPAQIAAMSGQQVLIKQKKRTFF